MTGRAAALAVRAGVAVLALGLVALLTYGVLAQAPDTTIDDALSRREAQPAPRFTLPVMEPGSSPPPLSTVVDRAVTDGGLGLDELRGTPVVLNFWASWCEPCKEEAGVLQEGWTRAASRGVLFLGLDQQDARADARAFLRRYAVTYPNVHEAGSDTSRRYGLTGLPETYFISPAGMVVGHVVGVIDADQLRRGVQAAQTGRPVNLGTGGGRQGGG